MVASRHKLCVKCGVEFVPGSPIAKYCGTGCRPRHRGPQPKVAAHKRGYDSKHQSARKAALRAMRDGDLCSRYGTDPECPGPMFRGDELDLDHDDDDRRRYNGLAHSVCNRRAGARKLAAARTGAVNSQEW